MRGAEAINPKDWTPRELRHSFVSLLFMDRIFDVNEDS